MKDKEIKEIRERFMNVDEAIRKINDDILELSRNRTAPTSKPERTADSLPPLNVRVHRALGNPIAYDDKNRYGWHDPSARTYPENHFIPHYNTDTELAMQALEEYCDKQGTVYTIKRNRLQDYKIEIFPPFRKQLPYNYPLPKAICLAIVNHCEARD